MLQQPAEGQRHNSAPQVESGTLLAMQVGPGQRKQEIPDKELPRTAIRDLEQFVNRAVIRDFHGLIVLQVANPQRNPGGGTVGERGVIGDSQAAQNAWTSTANSIRNTLTKAGYANVNVSLKANVHYTCTNHFGAPNATANANLLSTIEFIIEVQATKGGVAYEKTLSITWKGVVIQQGTPGQSYPKPER